jgi:hypothetical protein
LRGLRGLNARAGADPPARTAGDVSARRCRVRDITDAGGRGRGHCVRMRGTLWVRHRRRRRARERLRANESLEQRASGEEATRTQEELLREATKPGTPRLKSDKL